MQWDQIFLTPAQLRFLIDSEPQLKIFDCRFQLAVDDQPAKGIEFFQQGHIPRSSYLDLENDLSGKVTPQTGRHPLPSRAQLEQLCHKFKLKQDEVIVCYDQGKLAFAARAWLTFQLLGFTKVRILSGGYKQWQEQQSEPQKVTVEPVTAPIQLLDLNVAMLPEQCLVDARERSRFLGEQEPIDPIAGAIPGAINRPWLENFNSEGLFQPIQWHQQHWKDLEPQNLVHYCGSGVTALVNIISALLGTQQPQGLYLGGWSEYINSEHYTTE